MAPPTPPPSSPPPLNSPIEEEGVVNSSLTTPLTGGDEYGSLEEPKQETLTTSNFKLSSSPSSPPSSLPPDSEVNFITNFCILFLFTGPGTS